MKSLRSVAVAAALLIAAASPSFAAGLFSTLPPVPPAVGLSGSEDTNMDTNLSSGASPQTEDVTTQQLRAHGYQQSTPLTGFAIVAGFNTNFVQITPAGTLAAGSVTLPALPVDGQTVKIFSTQIVTAFTLTPATGQTINGTAVTTLAANTPIEYMFNGATSVWYRVQ